MENCGIVVRCSKNYRNEMGKIVQISEALSLLVNLVLKYPDFLLHVDKTGFNLNSWEDCKVGGKNFIEGVLDKKFMRMYNETDCRATVLGFTNSIREAVLCVIIIKATQLEYCEKYGIIPHSLRTLADGSDLDLERNMNTIKGK